MCLNSYFPNSLYLYVYVGACFISGLYCMFFNIDNQFPNNIHMFFK
jgi:hypothetical protein